MKVVYLLYVVRSTASGVGKPSRMNPASSEDTAIAIQLTRVQESSFGREQGVGGN